MGVVAPEAALGPTVARAAAEGARRGAHAAATTEAAAPPATSAVHRSRSRRVSDRFQPLAAEGPRGVMDLPAAAGLLAGSRGRAACTTEYRCSGWIALTDDDRR